jgi:hypothetical protein
MNVLDAIVFLRYADSDMVRFNVAMPSSFPTQLPTTPLELYIYAETGTGEKYVKTNFPGVPVRVTTLITKEDYAKAILEAFERTFGK